VCDAHGFPSPGLGATTGSGLAGARGFATAGLVSGWVGGAACGWSVLGASEADFLGELIIRIIL
jgi:hypothetical protein